MPYAALHSTHDVLAANRRAEQAALDRPEALRLALIDANLRLELADARAAASRHRRELAAIEARIERLSRELGDRLATVTAAGRVA